MTDKSAILRAFNKLFFDFFTYIIDTISEKEEVTTAKTALEQIKKMNPTIILKSWCSFIYLPYQAVIDTGNIDFIIDKDYKNDVSKLSNADKLIKVINKIREPIREMNLEQREQAVYYIQGLSKLSMMYNTNT